MPPGIPPIWELDEFSDDEPTLKKAGVVPCYTCGKRIGSESRRLESVAGVEVCLVCCLVNGLKVNA